MRLLQTMLLTALLALSPLAQGETQPSAQEVVTAVEATYKDVQSIQADFVQTTRSIGSEVKQKGKVQIKRPRKMRWDFAQPAASSFITDGQKLWVWSEADNQVMVTDDLSGAASGSDMSQLLGDLSRLNELFNVQTVSQPAGSTSYTLSLTPKTTTSFTRLEIEVAQDGYTLKRVVVVDDNFDTRVELDFSAVEMNPEIADDRFTFVPPEGATVIDAGGL